MCVKQKCMAIESLRLSGATDCGDCSGNGMCNSRGNCHCHDGFAPPSCKEPGVGGSIDSGPASDPNSEILSILLPDPSFNSFIFYF